MSPRRAEMQEGVSGTWFPFCKAVTAAPPPLGCPVWQDGVGRAPAQASSQRALHGHQALSLLISYGGSDLRGSFLHAFPRQVRQHHLCTFFCCILTFGN